jgi:hypothetical protein
MPASRPSSVGVRWIAIYLLLFLASMGRTTEGIG